MATVGVMRGNYRCYAWLLQVLCVATIGVMRGYCRVGVMRDYYRFYALLL